MVGEGGLGRQGPALFQAQTYIQGKIKIVNGLGRDKSCLFTKNTASRSSGVRGTACLVTSL